MICAKQTMNGESLISRFVPVPLRDSVRTIRSVVTLAADRNLTYLAAGIAFYAFVSIIPLILLTVSVASFIGGEQLATRVIDTLGRQLSSAAQGSVTRSLTETAGRGAASVVGFLGLTWSSLKLFRGLDQAFGVLYPTDVDTSLLNQVWNGLVVVFGITLAIALVMIVGAALSFLTLTLPFSEVLGSALLAAGLGLVFLPIYYVLPPVDVPMSEVVPGAVVTAGGWVLLQFGFRFYASNATSYALYGMIGAVLMFLMWLYFASIVILLGGAVNATLCEARLDEM